MGIPVVDMAEEIGMPIHTHFDIGWGDRPQVELDQLGNKALLSEVIKEVMEDMIRDPMVSGSSVTARQDRGSRVRENSDFLRDLQCLLDREVDLYDACVDVSKTLRTIKQTMKVVYSEGGYKLGEMSKASYFMLKLLLGMSGPNIDAHGYNRFGDVVGNNKKMQTLMRVLGQDWGSDMPAIVGQANYFGKFISTFFCFEGDTLTSGFNTMLLGQDHEEKHITSLNYRWINQTGKLINIDGAMVVDITPDLEVKDMEMIGCPATVGKWVKDSARAIRIMVMDGGFDQDKINIDSFLEKMPKDVRFSFEDIVVTLQNMIVAEKHNPDLTRILCDKLQLNTYFNQNHTEVSRMSLLRDIDNAQLELLGERVYEWVDYEYKLSDLLDIITKYLPVKIDALMKVIPGQSEREVVTGYYIGDRADSLLTDDAALAQYVVGGGLVWAKTMYMEARQIVDEMIGRGVREGFDPAKMLRLINGRDELLAKALTVDEGEKKYMEDHVLYLVEMQKRMALLNPPNLFDKFIMYFMGRKTARLVE